MWCDRRSGRGGIGEGGTLIWGINILRDSPSRFSSEASGVTFLGHLVRLQNNFETCRAVDLCVREVSWCSLFAMMLMIFVRHNRANISENLLLKVRFISIKSVIMIKSIPLF